MDKRRIFYIIGFVLISIALGYFLYRIFFAPKKSEITTPGQGGTGQAGEFPNAGTGGPDIPTSTGPTGLPTGTTRPTTRPGTTGQVTYAGEQGQRVTERTLLKQVVTARVSNAQAGADGSVRFYSEQDGKFYRVDAQGNTVALSDQVFYNVDNVTWSPQDNKAILEYPDGANIYYNFDTKEQATLPKHWEQFAFSPTSDKIAAKSMGYSPENRWLITSDPDGNNIKIIEPMGNNADKVTVDWSPSRQVVALSRTGEALGSYSQEVLLVGLNHENFKSVVVEGRGLETKWTPQGTKLLHSVYNASGNYKPELWIVDVGGDTTGNNRKPLGIQTWASKCTAADERFVYCGVPLTLQTGAGFAPSLADSTVDNIVKIDTVTGIQTILDTDSTYTIDSMFVSGDGGTLFFTDKNKNGVFSYPLK